MANLGFLGSNHVPQQAAAPDEKLQTRSAYLPGRFLGKMPRVAMNRDKQR